MKRGAGGQNHPRRGGSGFRPDYSRKASGSEAVVRCCEVQAPRTFGRRQPDANVQPMAMLTSFVLSVSVTFVYVTSASSRLCPGGQLMSLGGGLTGRAHSYAPCRSAAWSPVARPALAALKQKEAAAAPPPSESKWRELRRRTPFSDPFQRSGGTVANIPRYGDWSSQAVNQQKGDGSSGGSTAKVRLDARASMRREPAASFGVSWSYFGGSPPPYCRRRCFDGASPVPQ
jgi:hypothetical protein